MFYKGNIENTPLLGNTSLPLTLLLMLLTINSDPSFRITNTQSVASCHYECMLSHLSHVLLFTALWTAMGFPRQEHWGGLPCPPPRALPNQELDLRLTSLPH